MKNIIVAVLCVFSATGLLAQTRPDYSQIKNTPLVSAASYGLVGDGVTDDTAKFNHMVSLVPEHSIINFEPGKTYVGNFVATKSLTLDFQGATVIPSTNITTVGFLGSETFVGNISGTLTYGDTTITIADHGLVAGDIFYVVDERKRPSDNTPAINTEILTVATSTASTIKVHDMIRSEQASGVVKLYKINPIISPQIKNCNIQFSNTSTEPGIYIKYALSPIISNCSTVNNYGSSVRTDFCHSVVIENSTTKFPRVLAGYGVLVNKCRNVIIKNIEGWSVDTIVDLASTYCATVEDIRGSAEVGVTLAHNTFGGNIRCKNVDVNFSQYGVVFSRQGLPTADYATFKTHDISIESVNGSTEQSVDVSFAVCSLQTLSDNFTIRDISLYAANKTAGVASASSVVMVYGSTDRAGQIEDITANFVWTAVRFLGPNNTKILTDVPITVKNISVSGTCDHAIYAVGIRALYLSKIFGKTVNTSVIYLAANGSVSPLYVSVDDSEMPYVNVPLFTMLAPYRLRGKPPESLHRYSSAITIDDPADKITESDLFGRYGGLNLSASGSVTLATDTPIVAPSWVGQELLVRFTGSGGSLTIASGTNTVAIATGSVTLTAPNFYLFKDSGAGVWNVSEIGSFSL